MLLRSSSFGLLVAVLATSSSSSIFASASAATSGGLPENAASLPAAQLLSLATSALTSGKTATALQVYDHLLERDPNDVATLYKRATVRYALGQWSRAKEGFYDVLERNDAFDEARVKLGHAMAKLGEYSGAREQVSKLGAHQAHAQEAAQLVSWAVTCMKHIITEKRAPDTLRPLLHQLREVNLGSSALEQAKKASKAHQWTQCVNSATTALQVSPNSDELRLLRSHCYLHLNEFDSSVGDLSRAATLTSALPDWLMLRWSLISAFLLDPSLGSGAARELNGEGLTAVKKCLNADPDSKACRKVFKLLKKMDKEIASKWKTPAEAGRWLEVTVVLNGSPASPGLIQQIKDLFETYAQPLTPNEQNAPLPSTPNLVNHSPVYRHALSDLCHGYLMISRTQKARSACEASLAVNPDDVWGLVGKGEKLLSEEKWDEAVQALSVAFEKTGQSDREVLGRLQKAQRLAKQSKQKDYYKILGVSRDADGKTIKRAYRKGTLKAHPDKEGGSEEKMAALNEAYEVLSNPELRQRFDNGDDPNDQQSGGGHGQPFFHQGGGGGHPFEQFFQQGQGGGGHQHTFRWG
ncbi:BZ3500_MvSof-1268-A1-R1_Chr7-3g09678 [Microbotryum saponariae]|uniref:BZ3500_MvSof-1268-A1-R1_Chr7-3g09678 protein n=1 Tax=Microbotryum saponariae TaxID=289078 RepID=A0A2X0L9Y1_9BASI|nr:BZ3501_MvSof-1269-A2-R1_Chr7-2g09401 [Microbotryum saponariae]SDA02399.1 BZ3500_MvSof-1268-A1-R1_Chr7-3g09678 [Microbotryum saponariae]